MKERQDGQEGDLVIRLPANEIQRRIGVTRKLLKDLNGQVSAFHTQPRNQEGHAWLAGVERQIAQHQGMLAAYEDAQTIIEWEESPEEERLRQERAQQLATLIREPWLSLTEAQKWFLMGYRWGGWEISTKLEK